MKHAIVLLLAFASCTNTNQSNQLDAEPLILTDDAATNQYGYRDTSDKMAIPLGKYAQCLTDTFRTHAIVMTKSDSKWVVIDRQEKVLYEIFPYDNGLDYASEGLFRIVKDGKIGYADASTYAIVIPPQFDCAYPFENGKAKVSTNCKTVADGEYRAWTSDEWKYVDKKGVF
jgi:hypothetical protein